MSTRPPVSRTWTLLVLLVLTATSIVIAVVMSFNEDIQVDTLTYELGTRVADAGLATGLGAVVGLLVWQYQKEQAEAREQLDAARESLVAKNEWLRSFALDVANAYGDLKQARRRLQWDVDNDEGTLTTKVYDDQIAALSEVQSRFEALHAVADTELVSNARRSSMLEPLRAIDKAVSNVISERKGGRHATAEREVSLSSRPMVAAFVAESHDGDGQFDGDHGFSKVKDPFKAVMAVILGELQDRSTG